MLLANTGHGCGHRVGLPGHVACGALGGFITATVLVVGFTELVSLTAVLGLISASTLVLLTLFWWAVWWLALEFVADRTLSRFDSGGQNGADVGQ